MKIEADAAKLVAEYKDDLEPTLGVELVQFASFCTHFPGDEGDKIGRERLQTVVNKKVADTFPNAEIML